MDTTEIAIADIGTLGVIVLALLGYAFLVTHWEDIKTLALVALVMGGGVTIAYGGINLGSRR